MKTFYINNGCNIVIDQDTNSCSHMISQREAIGSIYLAEEPMHVIYGEDESRREFDVKKDDILIRFYEDRFPNKIVVVKNKEWAKNLKDYNNYQQEMKEQWAAKHKESNDCLTCDACCA